MTSPDTQITAATPMLAIEHFLLDAVISNPPQTDREGSFLLGYNVDAVDLSELIRKATLEIHSQARDHGALIVACEVSGFHGTDEGHRLWGTIECVPGRGGIGEATRVDNIRLEQVEPSTWRITGAGPTRSTQ